MDEFLASTTGGTTFSGHSNDPLAPIPTLLSHGLDQQSPLPIIEETDEVDGDETFTNTNPSRLWGIIIYSWKWVGCIFGFFFDLLSADNPSLVSVLARIILTVASYGIMFTNLAGQILWGMAYLIDHGWYPLAATSSVLLLVLAAAILTSYEWMWRWHGWTYCGGFSPRGGANGIVAHDGIRNGDDSDGPNGWYRPILVVMDDNEIDLDEDLSMRAWMITFGKGFGFAFLWLLYCLLNVRVDFWVWNMYLVSSPNHHPLKLRLIASVAASPIVVGAAVLLYFAYPPFYRWHRPPAPTIVVAGAMSSRTAAPFHSGAASLSPSPWSDSHDAEGGESGGLERLLLS